MNSSLEVEPVRSPPSDVVLADELVAWIDRLRLRGYGQIVRGIDQALRSAADRFKDLLGHYLLREEGSLFPALKGADSTCTPVIDGLQQEHAYLLYEAELLADLVRSGKDGAASARGQCFLTAMYDHMYREADAIYRATDRMDRKAGLRLKGLQKAEGRDRP